MRCSRALLALAALLGCGRSPPLQGPAPAGVEPAAAHTVAQVPVQIHGEGFYLSGTHRLGSGTQLDSTFRAWLGQTELQEVEWVDAHTLRAIVPAGLAGDPLDLVVEGPTGRGILAKAFRAAATTPAALVASVVAPAAVEAGTSFEIRVDLTNSGETDALAVVPALAGFAAVPIDPVPVGIPAGSSVSVRFSASAVGRGEVEATADAPGSDGFTGSAFPGASAARTVQVLAAPSLTLAARAPSPVGVGQTFTASIDVTNGGDIDVHALRLGDPAAATLVGTSPPAQDVPAGATRTYSWALRIDQRGEAMLATSGPGTDAFTGASLQAEAEWPAVEVQTPAVLSASPVVQGSATVGDPIPLRLDVTNQGDATASAVQASLTIAGGALAIASAPAPQDVPGWTTRSFVWQLRTVGPGSARLDLNASGTDATLGVPVSAPASTATVVVQAPASLSSQLVAPAQVSAGQAFSIRLDVRNQGEAIAASVVPSAACGGAGSLAVTSWPPAQDVPGLSTRSFVWSFTAGAAGRVDCTFGAAGADGNDGRAISTAQSGGVLVQTRASLRIDALAIPGRINRGQAFPALLTVTNTGQAAAVLVGPGAPVLKVQGGANASTSSAPAAVTLAGGSSTTFTWAYTENGTAPGTLALSAGVSGQDANDPAGALTAGPLSSATAVVEDAASLVIQSVSLPATLSRGQTFVAAVTVVNVGQAVARGVVPNPDPPQSTTTGGAHASTSDFALPVDIPGGGSATFSWTFVENGTAPGTLRLESGASGTDANTGLPIAAARLASSTATVQARAALAITAFTLPGAVSRGQTFTAALEVTNTGQATALQVLPGPLPPSRSATGGADVATSSSPAPVDIAGGAKATFLFTYVESGAGPGTVALSASASGLDTNDGLAVSSAAASSNTCAVQTPAALALTSITAPARVSRGQGFTVSVVVTNIGGATANAVQPSPAPPLLSTSGASSATTSSVNPPVALGGGQSATFSWSYVENGTGPGSLSFSVGATGTDQNSGAALAASAATASTTVRQPAQIAVTSLVAPSAITRGQRFTVLETVTNAGEATARAVVPAPSPPSLAVLSGGVHASTTSAPAEASIPGGSSATFAWSYVEDGTSGGTLQFSAGATGTDSSSGATLTAPVPTGCDLAPGSGGCSPIIKVQAPSQVIIQSFSLPTTLTRGQAFTLSLVVKNVGGTDVNNFGPSPNPPTLSTSGSPHVTVSSAPPPPVTLAANGGTATFDYSCVEDGSAAGSISFATTLVGTEALSLNPISLSAPSNTAIVQTAPNLQVTSFAIPGAISRGQTFTATLVARNLGTADAVNALPDVPTLVVAGGAHASVAAPAPAAQSIRGGASATFTWTLVEDGSASGTLSLQSTVRGTDANTGAAVASPLATSSQSAVERPAALTVSALSAPAAVSRGQPFTVTMTVTNSGEATAVKVQPSPSPPAVATTGGAAATTATAAQPLQLAGGQSATFSWSFVESGSGTGTLSFSGGVTGVDANAGVALSASAAPATTSVQRPASLSVASLTLRSASGGASIDRGQGFTATITLANGGEAAALNVLPSPAAPALATTGGAAARMSTGPAAANIPGGGSASFTWTFAETGTAPGTLQLSTGASGVDANSGGTVAAPTATSNLLAVQTPPSLAISSFTLPARISRGQSFNATLSVSNAGGATANLVLPDPPSVALTGGAHASVLSSPAAATIAGGASATFTWTCAEDGTGVGTLVLTTRVSGVDANTGGALSTPNATTGAALVQRPAALTITSLSAPAAVSRGQSFAVALTVTNSGQAAALNVLPAPNPASVTTTGGAAVSGPAAAIAVTIAGGSSATFTWSYLENGSGPGSLSFGAGAAGVDANSGATLTVASSGATTQVQQPASLSVTSVSLRSASGRSAVNRGQAFSAVVTVSNAGQATANGVLPTTPSFVAGGGAAAAPSTTPSPANIAGGSSATFTYGYVESGASTGTLTASAGANGTDANSAAAISAATVSSGTLQVQLPAALAASFSSSMNALRGPPFTVTLSVSNNGEAAASAVTPGLAVSGAGAQVLSGPTPSGATIPGGSSASFSWSCSATTNGPVALTAGALGTDVNDAGVRVTSATGSMIIADVVSLAADPFRDGTSFGYLFDFVGRVYLGPGKNGRGAVRMLPDGSNAEPVAFTFNADSAAGNRNTAGRGGPYPSLGFTGCSPNSLDCGPDNEDGRGLFGAGSIAGTPWLFAAGSTSTNGLAHFYMTSDTMSAPDFSYVDTSGILGAQTRGTESMLVFRDRVYVGLPNVGVTRPRLVVLRKTPPPPGFAPQQPSELVDLKVDTIGGFGGNTLLGLGANPATIVGIDSLAAFNDKLYATNNGGIIRSTDNDPQPPGLLSSSFANATPSAAAYTAKTSLSLGKTRDLEPADKAFPQMAVLGGRLYAARNTTTGPQLWVCAPGVDSSCDPGDWTLLAPNSSGDGRLSQFNDANNKAISLLAATAATLYVGYNNAGGVRIYRSRTSSPAARADFEGAGGCNAANAPGSCDGLGGAGLGAAATRIFDARALTWSGVEYLYLTAGTGTSGFRVFRLAR